MDQSHYRREIMHEGTRAMDSGPGGDLHRPGASREPGDPARGGTAPNPAGSLRLPLAPRDRDQSTADRPAELPPLHPGIPARLREMSIKDAAIEMGIDRSPVLG